MTDNMMDTDDWIAFQFMDTLMDIMMDNMTDINGHVILYFTDFSTVHKSGARM